MSTQGATAQTRDVLVLVVGCRRQLLESARTLGFKTVVVAGPWEQEMCADCLPLAHDVLAVDNPTQVDAVLDALARRNYEKEIFDGVVTASDEYVGVCALLSLLVSRSPWAADHRTATRWRDKYLQKEAVRAAGVNVARAEVIEDIRQPPATVGVPFPAVVKPLSAAAAAHTTLVRTLGELPAAARKLAGRTPKRTFLVEEFIEGTEYQIDAVVHRGKLLFVSVARYLVNPLQSLDGPVVRAATVDPDEDPALYTAVRSLVRASAAALGVTSSVLHIEAFQEPDGRLVFGECGVRVGGCFTPEMVRAKFGVDLAAAALQLSVGLPPDLPVRTAPGVFCRSLLPPREGILRAALSTEALLAHPDVCAAEIQRPLGALLPHPDKNAVARVGEVVVTGTDFADVDRRTLGVIAWHLDHLEVEGVGDPADLGT